MPQCRVRSQQQIAKLPLSVKGISLLKKTSQSIHLLWDIFIFFKKYFLELNFIAHYDDIQYAIMDDALRKRAETGMKCRKRGII